MSFLDPVAVGIGAPRKLVYLARDTLFRFKPFAYILRRVNTFPLRRETGDLAAFKLALGKLSEGCAVLVFPEGTRSKDGKFQEAKLGIGFLQKATGAGILPCYVKGSMDALPRHSPVPKFKPVSVYFGKTLNLDNIPSGDKKQRYAYVANKTMEAIAELKQNAN
jgi:1-acyl-sn-glycerol-3-phosphate acyltransferase